MHGAKQIRRYLLQDLSYTEKRSYFNYINGDESEIRWISKTQERIEPLLQLELKCTLCNSYIIIRETGVCKCFNDHICYGTVLSAIAEL